jgi:hypothetical protein
MPSKLEVEREYEELKNIILSILFVMGVLLFMCCCGYCIMKKGEREEKEKGRYKTKIIQNESV